MGPLRSLASGDEGVRIHRAPHIVAALADEITTFARTIPHGRSLGFVGCGSSLDIPDALVRASAGRAVARSASEAEADEDRTWVAITRSGATQEVLDAWDPLSIRHVITVEPDSPAAGLASHVLDLAPASDTGFVAATSALVTAAATAILLGADREEVERELTDGLTGVAPPLRGSVAWLTPWGGFPFARELVRKTVESGRGSAYAHPFEFLHGDDLQFGDGSSWVIVDSAARIERFLSALDLERRERVIPVQFAWEDADPSQLVGLLARAYAMIFGDQGVPS